MSAFLRSFGVFIQAFMNRGSCSVMLDISIATDIGPSQFSTRYISLWILSTDTRVKRVISFLSYNFLKRKYEG